MLQNIKCPKSNSGRNPVLLLYAGSPYQTQPLQVCAHHHLHYVASSVLDESLGMKALTESSEQNRTDIIEAKPIPISELI